MMGDIPNKISDLTETEKLKLALLDSLKNNKNKKKP